MSKGRGVTEHFKITFGSDGVAVGSGPCPACGQNVEARFANGANSDLCPNCRSRVERLGGHNDDLVYLVTRIIDEYHDLEDDALAEDLYDHDSIVEHAGELLEQCQNNSASVLLYLQVYQAWLALYHRLGSDVSLSELSGGSLKGPWGLKGKAWRNGYRDYWRTHGELCQENSRLQSVSSELIEYGDRLFTAAKTWLYVAVIAAEDIQTYPESIRLRKEHEEDDFAVSFMRTVVAIEALLENTRADLPMLVEHAASELANPEDPQ